MAFFSQTPKSHSVAEQQKFLIAWTEGEHACHRIPQKSHHNRAGYVRTEEKNRKLTNGGISAVHPGALKAVRDSRVPDRYAQREELRSTE
jgi:hypothetical protein